MDAVLELLHRGAAEGVFPHASLAVMHRGQLVLSTEPDRVFDLASLTKVMSTTALVLDARLPLDAPVQRWLPAARVQCTLEDLLFHRSGLPPFLPYFADELNAHPELAGDATPALRASVRQRVLERVLATPAERAPGLAAAYSDLGFVLLGAVLETVAPLDALFAERVARPLGLPTAGYRRISSSLPLPPRLAPTGATRPREPAPGQEGLWQVPERPTRPGEVDDDNAFCLDGVSGHAGLFATAPEVAAVGQAVLEGRFPPPRPWGRDGTPGSTRALGFDTPSEEGASCGRHFGRSGPRGAIGHLGFTGTSVWIDLDRDLVVALLTNRVALGRANLRIREFRPRLHDAVAAALGC